MNYQDKKADLTIYTKSVGSSPAQRSAEWYAIKKITIGGSEIATVLGLNPYKKVKDLIAEKIGLQTFNGSIATRWGTLFEPVTKEWTEKILQMQDTICELGSVEGIHSRQRYSPDGLGIVKLKCFDGTFDYYIVLFEFKAPYSKFLNGQIPKYYTPQIQTGLLNIPIADVSIYVANCYRKCALSDLNFSSVYDSKFHAADYKKRKTGLNKNKPLACGLICFYQTIIDYYKLFEYLGYLSDDEDDGQGDQLDQLDQLNTLDNLEEKQTYDYKDGDIQLLLDSKETPIDFGKAPMKVVDRALELYDNKKLGVIYYPIVINHTESNENVFIKLHGLQNAKPNAEIKAKSCIDRFIKRCPENGFCPVGYLPWKLMESDIILEDRDEDWKQKIEKPIEDAIKALDSILNNAEPHTKYNQLYSELSAEYIADICNDLNEFAIVNTEVVESPE